MGHSASDAVAPGAEVMLADPRTFPQLATASAEDAAIHALAAACLVAPTGQAAAAARAELLASLERRLRGSGEALASLFAGSPSVAVTRLLWRTLDDAWRGATLGAKDGIALTLFAVPLVVIVGANEAPAEGSIAGVLRDAGALSALLEAGEGLAGSRSVSFAPVLLEAEAIDYARLPGLLASQHVCGQASTDAARPAGSLAAAPIVVRAGSERAHLRFLLGSAVAAPGIDLLGRAAALRWAMPFAQELARQLASPQATVLALPRALQNPLRALRDGRAAQREVSAQLFASNALRALRTRAGEPVAVLSAHRAADAPGGGELRVSLSSPLEPRDAEGFRCPLFALDRVADVAKMLVDLLVDCRVTDVRLLRGVHPDRAPEARMPLLFKPDTIPAGAWDGVGAPEGGGTLQ
jgi:hypothetical protein